MLKRERENRISHSGRGGDLSGRGGLDRLKNQSEKCEGRGGAR
jgi:hypothetical protein